MIKITLTNEPDLINTAKEGFYLLKRYVELVDIWKTRYGSENKTRMEECREQIIKFLKDPTKKTHRSYKDHIAYAPDEDEPAYRKEEVDPEDKYIEERIFGKD